MYYHYVLHTCLVYIYLFVLYHSGGVCLSLRLFQTEALSLLHITPPLFCWATILLPEAPFEALSSSLPGLQPGMAFSLWQHATFPFGKAVHNFSAGDWTVFSSPT